MNSIVLLVILVGIVLFFIWLYNTLIAARLRVHEALSQIDVQLKRRIDLIPNLIETVKGYAKHEKEVFTEVTKARTALMSAKGTEDKAKANNMLTDALKTIFAIAEAYPQLRATENFKALQDELADTENKIAYSRQFYNSNVLNYNTKIATVPYSFFAGIFNFKPAEFFAATEAEKKAIKVSF